MFFVGYNLVLASVLLSTYPFSSEQRTIYFGNGDFVPWTLVYNPDFTFMQSRPFQLSGGEILTGTFEVYRLWNGSGVPMDPSQEVQVKLEPPDSLFSTFVNLGGSIPIWMATYSTLVPVPNYRVPLGATYTFIVSTYTRDCNNNCSVDISGTLTATTPPSSQAGEFALAAAGVVLMASPGLWVVGERLRRGRGGGQGKPPSPPSA